eukprot:56108_1
MFKNIISLNNNQFNDPLSTTIDLLGPTISTNNTNQQITPLSMPECQVTKSFERQSESAMYTSLKNPCMSINSIINIIIEYAKIGKFTFHSAQNIIIPKDIFSQSQPTSQKQKSKENVISYKNINNNEISHNFMSLFSQPPVFGDIIIFKNRHAFIGFDNSMWICSRQYSSGDTIWISIPNEITCHKPDASYFYNIPFLITHEFHRIDFGRIRLRSDDIWLRKQLEIPINKSLTSDWEYYVILSRNMMMQSVGELFIKTKFANKSFKINGYQTVQHMHEYFEIALQPKITFKVRYVGCYESQKKIKSSTNEEDILPMSWDRQMTLMDGGFYLYNFTAPKSEITQENICRVEDFVEPFLKKLMNNSFDGYVVVGVIVVYVWGDTGNYKTNDHGVMSKSRQLFEQRIHEIFGGWYSNWKRYYGIDEDIFKKYDINVDRIDDRRCNVYYGPKAELNDKIEKLEMFMKSEEHKQMQPYIKLETVGVQDPLNEINNLLY